MIQGENILLLIKFITEYFVCLGILDTASSPRMNLIDLTVDNIDLLAA